MADVTNKLQALIDKRCDLAERYGSTILTISKGSSWDMDVWINRNLIIEAIRKRGYRVNSSFNYGVLDVVISKQITLN